MSVKCDWPKTLSLKCDWDPLPHHPLLLDSVFFIIVIVPYLLSESFTVETDCSIQNGICLKA